MHFIQILSFVLVFNIQYLSAVPFDDCPEHSTLNLCMTRCPVTCSNYQKEPPECLQICQVGCECQPGFIKVQKSPWSPCVRQYECQLYRTKKEQTGSKPYLYYKKYANGILSQPNSNAEQIESSGNIVNEQT